MTSMKKMLGLLVLGLGMMAPAHAATTHDVDVANFAFTPATVQAASGDTIHWTWSSGTHTVTAYVGDQFDSGTRATGSFDRTFHGGTLLYYCSIHSSIDPVTLTCNGTMCGAITDKTTAPSVPAISAPVSNETVKSSPVRVSGTSDEGTTVNVIENGGVIGTAVADGTGRWNADVDLANGTHSVQAQATDVDHRASAISSTTTFVLDAPDVQPPTVTIDQSSPQIFTDGGRFSGAVADDVIVDHVDVVFTDALGVSTLVRATCTCGTSSGTWQLDSGIPSGVRNVEARAVDGAGLVGTSASIVMINA